MNIDSLDERLIGLLLQDATQTSEVLSRQLSCSSSTIRRRMKELLENGVIRVVALPSANKSGFPLRAILGFQVAYESVNSVLDELRLYTEIKFLWNVRKKVP